MAEDRPQRAEERPSGRLRCPFCHDAVGEGERAACARCGARHHGACLVEGQGCASCSSRELIIDQMPVAVEELPEALADPSRASGLRRAWPAIGAAALIVVGTWSAFVAAYWGLLSPVFPIVIFMAALVAAFVALAASARRNQRGPRDDALAVVGMLPPDPTAGFEAELRATPAPPRPAGRPPRACPQCETDLANDDDPDPAWFCHHCGASLAG